MKESEMQGPRGLKRVLRNSAVATRLESNLPLTLHSAFGCVPATIMPCLRHWILWFLFHRTMPAPSFVTAS